MRASADGRRSPGVFSVGPDWVQLDWASLPRRPHTFSVGAVEVAVDGDGGAGAVTLQGFAPGQELEVRLDGQILTSVTTLVPPPGPVLTRIATLNDLHVGEEAFGFLPRVHSSTHTSQAHPMVCLKAALAEIAAWGPDLLVIKGDLADSNHPGEYALLAEALDGFAPPLLLIPGNHDGGNHWHVDPALCLAEHGLPLIDDVGHVDLPGVRVVGANSVWPGHDRGMLTPRLDRLVEELAGSDRPAFLAVHHQVMRLPVPTYLPPGLLGREANQVVAAVTRANPDTLIASGHSHRHRVRRAGSVLLVEAGSPKDYPGSWVAYECHETGIVQTAHRIADPAAIRWTERTWHTVGTMWGRWSRGRLTDRCFVHRWRRSSGQ